MISPRTAGLSSLWRSRARLSPLLGLPASARYISIPSSPTSDSPFRQSTKSDLSTSNLLYNVPSGRPSSASFSTSPLLSESDWDHNPNLAISNFSELPSKDFGVNQHMIINQEFKEALRTDPLAVSGTHPICICLWIGRLYTDWFRRSRFNTSIAPSSYQKNATRLRQDD